MPPQLNLLLFFFLHTSYLYTLDKHLLYIYIIQKQISKDCVRPQPSAILSESQRISESCQKVIILDAKKIKKNIRSLSHLYQCNKVLRNIFTRVFSVNIYLINMRAIKCNKMLSKNNTIGSGSVASGKVCLCQTSSKHINTSTHIYTYILIYYCLCIIILRYKGRWFNINKILYQNFKLSCIVEAHTFIYIISIYIFVFICYIIYTKKYKNDIIIK